MLHGIAPTGRLLNIDPVTLLIFVEACARDGAEEDTISELDALWTSSNPLDGLRAMRAEMMANG